MSSLPTPLVDPASHVKEISPQRGPQGSLRSRQFPDCCNSLQYVVGDELRRFVRQAMSGTFSDVLVRIDR